MSVRLNKRELKHHYVMDLEPQPAKRAAATCYELYVDLVYHLTSSPHTYEERLIDTAPNEQGLIGLEHLIWQYPEGVLLAARDVIEYSLRACGFDALPADDDAPSWRQLEEQIANATAEAAVRDVADDEWLNDLRGRPDPFLNRASIRRLHEGNRPVPLDELLGRRSLHPDVVAYLDSTTEN